ncbi:MAG: long-chain fatty acid--CoA ligase [Myxococcales bacterium]|nr:long-chain fatty acid--CoA ligase [Myxococcales bacterium]MCB9646255.1 long-chain fatty acid--CoA ligase [Deltaproteobacteria bacterium]
MQVDRHLVLKPTPRFLFDLLPERAERPRFMVPGPDGFVPVTHAEFARQIRAVASYLAEQGVRDEARVAVFAPNSVPWAASAMAIQSAGGVLVPVYPSNTADQAAYIVEHSDARVLLVDGQPLLERVLARFDAYEQITKVICMSDDVSVPDAVAAVKARGLPVPAAQVVDRTFVSWSSVLAQGAAADEADPSRFEGWLAGLSMDQMAVMLYTSGTTGHPKGVPLTHRNFVSNHRDWLEVLGPLLEEGDTDLLWLPMSHMFGYGETFVGHVLGWTSYLCSPQDVVRLLPEVKPGAFLSVPAYWEKLAQDALHETTPEARKARLLAATGGRLHFCLSGGAGLKLEVKTLFAECGILIIEGYGLTETSPTLTMNRPDAYRFDTVGKPFPSVELKLAEDGEILARGSSVFSGYHKEPVATQEAFTPDGWFKTGDVGRWTDDGFLQIIDRKKDILVTAGGKNVPPANIELRFRDDPLIAHLVVYGDGHKYLVAGVWLVDEEARRLARAAGLPASEWSAFLQGEVAARIEKVNAELAHHETIKRFKIMDTPLTVESGLVTPTLKVRRKRVYEAFRQELEALYA